MTGQRASAASSASSCFGSAEPSRPGTASKLNAKVHQAACAALSLISAWPAVQPRIKIGNRDQSSWWKVNYDPPPGLRSLRPTSPRRNVR